MKVIRKTNLFQQYTGANVYIDGAKSMFFPLSNYSESLTGSHLSVDAKLYPSAFICLYIKELDSSYKSKPMINNFMRRIVRFYENKMAFLRDMAASGDIDNFTLNNIEPLPYLLHYIQKNTTEFKIVYIGNIAEQDYDGVYSDMMMTIEQDTTPRKYDFIVADKYSSCEDWCKNSTDANKIRYNFSDAANPYLYGWSYKKTDGTYEYTGPSIWKDVCPGFDIGDRDTSTSETFRYVSNISSYYKGINCIYDSDAVNVNVLKFNFVIPLYDVFIDDLRSSSDQGTEAAHYIDDTAPTSETDVTTIDFTDSGVIKKKYNRSLYDTLVPYGIWWSGYRPVQIISSNGESPSWTLTLSQQFKPFPYSLNNIDANDNRSNLNWASDKEYSSLIHDTFAQILSRQNNAIDKIMEQDKSIVELRNEIEALKTLIKEKY